MSNEVEVSAIIPTYNRRDLVLRAIDCVLAQTRPVAQVIVVDDGSTDGTREALAARYGDRIEYVWQPNAGVSAARNHGLSLARGRYLALLDSDDEWLPAKTQRQVEWLEARPDYGMVLCDVLRVNADGSAIDRFRRREQLPEDGHVLRWVLRNPALAPVSAMLRRAVYEQVGGFDASLRTAEDLDFHLRVARHFPIGVIDEPLARAIRGHDGLSSLPQTYDDYVVVMERAAADARGVVDESEVRDALFGAYWRNARGMVLQRRWRGALALARKAWRLPATGSQRRALLGLLPLGLRATIGGLRRRAARA